MGDEPGDLVVEVVGVAGAGARPGDLRHRWPVRRAVHPRRVVLEEALQHPEVETAPPSLALALVVARGAHPTSLAAALGRLPRPDLRDQRVLHFVDLDQLDHGRLVDTENLSPYVGPEQRRSPHLVFEPLNSPKT